jgi:hypothetical protein
MVKLKCAGCGEITMLPAMPKKFLCKSCGAPNTPLPETYGTGAEACSCLLPTGFEWRLPGGVIGEGDNLMYSTPDDPNCYLTRIEWIEVYGYDPKAKLADMRRRGKEGEPGFVNLSTLGKGRVK